MPCPLRYVALVSSLAIVTMSVKATELIEDKTYVELFFDFISGKFLLNFFALKEKDDQKDSLREPESLQTSNKRQHLEKNYQRAVGISRKFLGLTAASLGKQN